VRASGERQLAGAQRDLPLGLADHRVRAEHNGGARGHRLLEYRLERRHRCADPVPVDQELGHRLRVEDGECDRRLDPRLPPPEAQVDSLLAQPPLEPAAPRVVADPARQRNPRPLARRDDSDVRRRAARVRNEGVRLVERGDGSLADQVDERLADAKRGGRRAATLGQLPPLRSAAHHARILLALGVSRFEIADGFRGLAQRVRPVDDRRDLSGFDELLQGDHVLVADLREKQEHPLAHEPRQHERPSGRASGPSNRPPPPR
jgi:hypothetical protein